MFKKALLPALIVILITHLTQAQNMSLEKLKVHLAKEARLIQDSGNVAEYELDSVRIYLITDVASDRMRLMAGVLEEKELKTADYKTLLEANYDRALDAKYALSDGILWSVFVHPLKDLSLEVATSGLYQVRNLVYTYGSSYTSTGLVYGSDKDDGN